MNNKKFLITGQNKIYNEENALKASEKQAHENALKILSEPFIVNYFRTDDNDSSDYPRSIKYEIQYNRIKKNITLDTIDSALNELKNNKLLIKEILIES